MEDIVSWRREIHRNAELSFEEHKTQNFLCSILSKYNIVHRRVAGTGVVAEIGDIGGDVVVLRADIDALPITETAAVDFASSTNGVMHACGHDLHASALLGALVALSADVPKKGGVVGLFQPGEEMHPGGASIVISSGVLDNYNIVAMVGQHCSPELRCGTFGFHGGQFMASTDEIHIHFRGLGGHAAQPELLKNPIWAAVDFLSAAHKIAPVGDIKHVLAFGKIAADGATNVIPNEVYVEGTFRTFSDLWRAECKDILRHMAVSIAQQHQLDVDLEIKDGYPSVFNNEELTLRAEKICDATFGAGSAATISQRMTAEDFGFYSQKYKTLFYRLGVGYADRDAGRLHTGDFCPNEDALFYGAKMLKVLAESFLEK